VISHETIHQHLLQIASIPKKREPVLNLVLFVEGAGVIKLQGKRKRAKEEKFAAIHQGWKVNGKPRSCR